jgi:predicted Rdx family selenoprotein
VVGGHGQFDVVVDGDTVFSKQRLGRFPEPGEIARLVGDPGAGRPG